MAAEFSHLVERAPTPLRFYSHPPFLPRAPAPTILAKANGQVFFEFFEDCGRKSC